MIYDAAIIGAGPAGIFAAAELARQNKKVVIIDKGRLIKERVCPILAGKVKACVNCSSCAVVSGWGGAGSASDGKLTLTTGFGGNLEEYIGREELERMIKYVDDNFVKFGADPNYYEADGKLAREIICSGAKAGLKVLPARIRHIGTDASREVLNNMYEDLNSKSDILMNTQVKDILIEDDAACGVILDN
ncbi:MAG: FAD-binding protein, partial [Synergistaceae bacterium]|nr:FAD-binding protein [Synergistaceae bacterium]